MNKLASEVYEHLNHDILPFWQNLKDNQYGGYYGYVDFNGNIDKTAVKGCILNSRILWFFSNAYMILKQDNLLAYADHAYNFLKKHCIDKEYGGIFWSVKYNGEVYEDIKHTYNQAFAIYALSSYYDITGKKEALDIAWELYKLIETTCRDDKGYLESFERDFKPGNNEKLSENGIIAEKTMNTLLHVFEAYTELYRVTNSEEVAEKLKWILDIFANKVYNAKKERQEVFFDKDWNSLINLHSYGHDIETSWLIDMGCEILADKKLTDKMHVITSSLAQKIYNRAYTDHSLLNECFNDIDDTHRIWWVQAEAVLGFYNEWEKSGNSEYKQAVYDIWEYIKNYMMDKNNGREWFWRIDENRRPDTEKPIVEPWKCPYHNGRMCFEIIKRSNFQIK